MKKLLVAIGIAIVLAGAADFFFFKWTSDYLAGLLVGAGMGALLVGLPWQTVRQQRLPMLARILLSLGILAILGAEVLGHFRH